MTAEKILKYDVIGKLSKFAPIKDAVYDAITTEEQLDGVIQPDQLTGSTGNQLTAREKALLGQGQEPDNEVE